MTNRPSEDVALSQSRRAVVEQYAGSWQLGKLARGIHPLLIEETRDPTVSDQGTYTYSNGVTIELTKKISWLNTSTGNLFTLVNAQTGQWEVDGGTDTTLLFGRVSHLENTTQIYEIFESVSTNTGTVTIPAHGTVLQGRYGETPIGDPISAIVLEISGSLPSDQVARDINNDPITVDSFNLTTGEYVLSGSPLTSVAFVYQITIPVKYIATDLLASQIIEHYYGEAIAVYGTITQAELSATSVDDLIYVLETMTYYQLTSESLTRDGLYVLNNADTGIRKGVSGYYSSNHANYNMIEPTGYSRMFIETEGDIFFNPATLAFTIQPQVGQSYFSFMIAGVEYKFATPQTLVISNVTGRHFLYFDTDRQLKELVNISEFEIGNIVYQKAYTSYIYWNATTGKGRCYNERHGNKMDGETHANLHLTRGTQFISGCEPSLVGIADGTGSVNSDAQIRIDDGLAADEDLPIQITNGAPQTLSPIAQIPVFYLEGAGLWNWDTATNFPVKRFGTGRLAYNNFNGLTWEQLQVPNNQYVLTHIWGTNDIHEPVIAVQGQDTYNTVVNARNGSVSELNSLILTGLFPEEYFPISTFILQTSDSYTNTVKARIRTTSEGTNFVDWRYEELSPASVITIHNNLTGRDSANSHPSSAISTNTSDFDDTSVPFSIDTNVELALKSIHDVVKEERSETKELTGFPEIDFIDYDFSEITRTYSIFPKTPYTEFYYKIHGKKYIKITSQSIVIPDVSGTYFIYFDAGTLVYDLSPPSLDLLKDVVFCAVITWNAFLQKATIAGMEAHHYMPGIVHKAFHYEIGSRPRPDINNKVFNITYTIGNGSIDSDAQFALDDGLLVDEDLEHHIINSAIPANKFEQVLSSIAQIPIMYMMGPPLLGQIKAGSYFIDTATNYAFKYLTGNRAYYNYFNDTGSNLIEANTIGWDGISGTFTSGTIYNNTWGLRLVPDKYYFATLIIATNDWRTPIRSFMGQSVDLYDADARATNDIANFEFGSFPTPEAHILYKCLWQTDSSYTNTSKTRLFEVSDQRKINKQGTAGSSIIPHSILSDLDKPSHPLTALYNRSLGQFADIPTFSESFDRMWSSGIYEGATITDNGNGTINISSGKGLLRDSASETGKLITVSIMAVTNFTLTDEAVNYIYADFNNGVPQYAVSTDINSYNCLDKCIVYRLYRHGISLHWIYAGSMNLDSNRKHRRLLFEVHDYQFISGGSSLGSVLGTLYVTLSAGAAYYGLNKVNHPSYNTQTGSTLTEWTKVAGVWTETASVTQLNVTQYQDGTNTQTLTTNRFGVRWFYVLFDQNSGGELHYILGTSNSVSSSGALVESPPLDLPGPIQATGALIGRIIIEKDSTAIDQILIETALGTQFLASGSIIHGSLANLLVDDHTMYQINWDHIAISSNFTIDSNITRNSYIEVDTTAGNITVTLPDNTTNLNKIYRIRKSAGSNNVIIQRAGTDTINDYGTSIALSSYGDYFEPLSGGSGIWYYKSKFIQSELSSKWTPSITNETGCNTTSVSGGKWTRSGSIVAFSVLFNTTASATSASFELSLPISSNFANTYEALGNLSSSDDNFVRGAVLANITNNTFQISMDVVAAISMTNIVINGQYEII